MKPVVMLALLFAFDVASAESPRRFMSKGRASYESGDFAAAATNFAQAAEAAPAAKLDPAVARYNEGDALIRQKRPEDAIRAYEESLRTTDLGLQARAFFNIGNAHMRIVERDMSQAKVDKVESHLDQAVKSFAQSLLLAPGDVDAKVNLEVADTIIRQLNDDIQKAEDLVRKVEELVSTYKYEEAVAILSQEVPELAQSFALRPNLKTKVQEMIKKINEVLQILKSPLLDQNEILAPATGTPPT